VIDYDCHTNNVAEIQATKMGFLAIVVKKLSSNSREAMVPDV
jgi:hypothetical protein